MRWLRWLLDGSAFITRDHCGQWTPALAGVYVAGNLLTALSYYAIPCTLLIVYARRHRAARMTRVPLRYQRVLIWFSTFILLCGTTHLCDCLAFAWPAYRLFTGITLATGLVSIYVAARLPWVLRENWNIVPVETLYDALDKAQAARANAEYARMQTEHRFERITEEVHALRDIAWHEFAEERLRRLDRILAVIGHPEDRQ